MHDCLGLLDSVAQSSLITENFCNKLKLIPTQFSIIGINQGISNITNKVNITLFSKDNIFKTSIFYYVVPIILNETPSISMAHNDFNIPNTI